MSCSAEKAPVDDDSSGDSESTQEFTYHSVVFSGLLQMSAGPPVVVLFVILMVSLDTPIDQWWPPRLDAFLFCTGAVLVAAIPLVLLLLLRRNGLLRISREGVYYRGLFGRDASVHWDWIVGLYARRPKPRWKPRHYLYGRPTMGLESWWIWYRRPPDAMVKRLRIPGTDALDGDVPALWDAIVERASLTRRAGAGRHGDGWERE